MQLTTSTLAAILAFTSSTFASPIDARQSTLQDFQVTTVGAGTPSGRPGSYPWATITAVVTDPNEYNLGTSESNGQAVIVPGGSQGQNCVAKWFTRNSESPLGRTWPCDATENGFWTMEVLAGSQGQFSSGDFKLKFTHVPDVLYAGARFTATITAEGAFKVGDNMQGSCGGSGVCGWGLKPEVKPVLLAATRS